MTADKALREMRERATWHPLDFNPDDLLRWADALEAAMREPVAEIRKSSHDTWCAFDPDLPPGTKLFALPPDAEEEIERLREAWRDRGDVIDLLQRKLMHLHNFPSHPGGHKDDRSDEAMVPEDWRHGWICAVEAMQEAVVNHSLTTQVSGSTSDGYHTFDELYEHRHALFLNLMAMLYEEAWYSRKHNDGSEMEGWFIAGINLPTGTISYHMPDRLYDAAMNTGATHMPCAPEWDGHKSGDVVRRLLKMVYAEAALGKEDKP